MRSIFHALALSLVVALSLAAQSGVYQDKVYTGTVQDFSGAALKLPAGSAAASTRICGRIGEIYVRDSEPNDPYYCTAVGNPGTWAHAPGGTSSGLPDPGTNGVLLRTGTNTTGVVNGNATDCVKVNGTSGTCGTGSGASALGQLQDFGITFTSSTITMGANCVNTPCIAGFANTKIQNAASATSFTGTGNAAVVLMYLDDSGVRRLGVDGTNITGATLSNFVLASGVTDFPYGSFAIGSCTLVSNQVTSCADARNAFFRQTITVGAPLLLTPTANGPQISCPTCGSGPSGGVTVVNVPIQRAPARCTGGQASTLADWGGDNQSGSAQPSCQNGNQQWGVLVFPDPVANGETHAITDFVIPQNWTGTFNFSAMGVNFNGGNMRFKIEKQCFGVGSDPSTITWSLPEFATAVSNGSGTIVQISFTSLNLTGLGCGSGKHLKTRFARVTAASSEATNDFRMLDSAGELPHQ